MSERATGHGIMFRIYLAHLLAQAKGRPTPPDCRYAFEWAERERKRLGMTPSQYFNVA